MIFFELTVATLDGSQYNVVLFTKALTLLLSDIMLVLSTRGCYQQLWCHAHSDKFLGTCHWPWNSRHCSLLILKVYGGHNIKFRLCSNMCSEFALVVNTFSVKEGQPEERYWAMDSLLASRSRLCLVWHLEFRKHNNVKCQPVTVVYLGAMPSLRVCTITWKQAVWWSLGRICVICCWCAWLVWLQHVASAGIEDGRVVIWSIKLCHFTVQNNVVL